jgi:hypothetical protein
MKSGKRFPCKRSRETLLLLLLFMLLLLLFMLKAREEGRIVQRDKIAAGLPQGAHALCY